MSFYYKLLKKKKENKKSVIGSPDGVANYSLLNSIKKPETKLEVEKIPEVKKLILEFLKKDKEYWENLKEPNQGIEKFNLLNKICAKIPINSNVFECALDELLVEQEVVPMELDNKVRFLIICL